MGCEEAPRSEKTAVIQGTDAEGSSRREVVTGRTGSGVKQRWRLEKAVEPKSREAWKEKDGGKMKQPSGRQGRARGRLGDGRNPDGRPAGERQARPEGKAAGEKRGEDYEYGT